jgi:hypothetical protein
MTVIATAAIKITAETGDLKGKLDDGSKSVRGFASAHGDAIRGADGHTLAIGKIERALAGYVGHAAGANAVTEVLATSLGSFAAGGIVVTGVLLGVTAIVGAYELLTSSAKKAKEEQLKLVEALGQRFRPVRGKGSAVNDEYDAALQRRADDSRHLKILMAAGNDAQVAQAYGAIGEAAPFLTRQKEIERVTEDLAKANLAIGRAAANGAGALTTVTTTARDMSKVAKDALSQLAAEVKGALGIFDILKTHGESSSTVNKGLISDYNRISEQIRNMGTEATPARAALMQLREELAANLVVAREIARVESTGTVGPLIGKTLPGVGTTANGALADAQGVQGRTPNIGQVPGREVVHVQTAIEKQAAQDALHAEMLKSAIQQSAATIASVVGSAILQVGSGRGSQIGGAIGGAIGGGIGGYYGGLAGTALGGALGAAVGSVIPVAGTIIGGFLGSAIGGLFGHHKKAVDANTSAVKALTQAMLLNVPSGFRVERYRYDASDPAPLDNLGRYIRSNASRGGANPLLAVA